MTKMSQSGETVDRHARWVAMWREAVRVSRRPMGLLELSTTSFIELSRRAAELLGTTPEGGSGLNYLSVAERPREAAETFRLVQEGVLDGIRARRQFRRPDGAMVEVESSGWAIRSRGGPDLGLWVADEVPSGADHIPVAEGVITGSRWHVGSAVDGTRVTLDDHWRMAHISTSAGSLLGRRPGELLAASILELTHPEDLAALLFAFARATTDTRVDVRVRLRHPDGSWRPSQVAPSLLDGDGRAPFALVVAAEEEPGAPGSNSEVATTDPGERSSFEGDPLRIATELPARGMVPLVRYLPDPSRFPALSRLTRREWEILVRLLDGERVPSIAADLFVSQSTVRHHLSSIFSKFGVHSQAELIRRLRSD